MVLPLFVGGRVGHCQIKFKGSVRNRGAFFYFEKAKAVRESFYRLRCAEIAQIRCTKPSLTSLIKKMLSDLHTERSLHFRYFNEVKYVV